MLIVSGGVAAPAHLVHPARGGATPRRSRQGDDRFWRWAIFSPALLLMLALSVLPLANLFLTSFYDVTWAGGRAIWRPVGIANYLALPADALFRAGLVNTFIFAVCAVAGQMLLGFVLALLCSRITRGHVALSHHVHPADPHSRASSSARSGS